MTPEMVAKSQENARKGDYQNVEFRLGEIEKLPVDDSSIDVIISNCVINLSPDKPRVFQEAFRVLKPGGRLMVSDMVLLEKLPKSIMKSATAYVSCIGGAVLKDEYLKAIEDAGFEDIRVIEETTFPLTWLTTSEKALDMIAETGATVAELTKMVHSVLSVRVQAIKP